MPSNSKAQFRFMKSIEEGTAKAPGLSPDKAKEFTDGMSKTAWKNLRDRAGDKKKKSRKGSK